MIDKNKHEIKLALPFCFFFILYTVQSIHNQGDSIQSCPIIWKKEGGSSLTRWENNNNNNSNNEGPVQDSVRNIGIERQLGGKKRKKARKEYVG